MLALSLITEEYKLQVTGVLHIGAHTCEERGDYHRMGLTDNDVIWIEGDPSLVQRQKISDSRVQIYQALISDVDNEDCSLMVASNDGGSSSILDFGTHKNSYPGIVEVNRIPLQTVTMDTFFTRHPELPIHKINLVNIDIQGAELKALRGMTSLLPQLTALYLEVNTQEVYKGCALLPDIDAFLSEYNFQRVRQALREDAGWGEALYIRKDLLITVSTEHGGFSNRIKSLVSTLRKNPAGRVYWPWHEWCSCHFSDLFSNDLEVPSATRASGTGWRLSVLPEDKEIVDGFSSHIDNREHNGRCIDHEYHRIPLAVRERYLPIFSTLVVNPNILVNVNKFEVEHMMGKNIVAVHLRTWKIDPYPGIRTDRTAHFIAHMASFPLNTTFLLSADCEDAVGQIASRFLGRVITYPRSVSRDEGRKSVSGQVEDFTELLALSRAKTLLASDRSTYSELIWWFGGCQAEVIVP